MTLIEPYHELFNSSILKPSTRFFDYHLNYSFIDSWAINLILWYLFWKPYSIVNLQTLRFLDNYHINLISMFWHTFDIQTNWLEVNHTWNTIHPTTVIPFQEPNFFGLENTLLTCEFFNKTRNLLSYRPWLLFHLKSRYAIFDPLTRGIIPDSYCRIS